MNLKEAYAHLEIPESSTKEEAKKAFRKLAAQYHPDKATGDTERFKKINEAYQLIETGRDYGPSQPQHDTHSYGVPFNIEDLFQNGFPGGFSPFGNQQQAQSKKAHRHTRNAKPKEFDFTITFKESILGAQRTLTYDRFTKCNDCEGNGVISSNNGCDLCKGLGTTTKRQGQFIVQMPCSKCKGALNISPCKTCQERGSLSSSTTISFNIPAGAKEGRNTLNLQGVGDYLGELMGSEHYSDIKIKLKVEDHLTLILEDQDVITTLPISLYEALQGATKSVETIDGSTDLPIPALSHNKDEIILPHLGLNRQHNQRVILQVNYPTDLQPLLQILNQEK